MSNLPKHLRAVVATPFSEESCRLIESIEPRLELIRDHTLVPQSRYPGDFAGDPGFRRTRIDQRRFDDLIDSAEALLGIPDSRPSGLARAIGSNPRLRWVHTMAAGGGSQIAAAGLTENELSRVIFTTSAGVHGAPLAEFAVLGVLAGAKALPRLLRQQRRHEWSERWVMGMVSQQTILVAGLGGIGRQVARHLEMLGAHVIGMSRGSTPVPGVAEFIGPDQLHETASKIDALVSTLPGTVATTRLFGPSFFERLKPGATVVNVGRGSVIDEAALMEGLLAQRVGFAALDVFDSEPLPTDSPFWEMDNVLISPHTAGLSTTEESLIAELFARNAGRYLDGQPLVNRVDTVEFY